MKVLLLNGSPKKDGCTYTALCEVGAELNANDVATEWFHIGDKPVRGCTGCLACRKLKRCVFEDDAANDIAQAIMAADGVVIGGPVYYAGVNGSLCALLDRVFYSRGKKFAGKVGAAVVSCRRAGSTASLDRLNKYFAISAMPVVSSQYWNMVHGNTPDEVRKDLEGLQIMRTLGRNMAWMLKSLDGHPIPEPEKGISTNFIR